MANRLALILRSMYACYRNTVSSFDPKFSFEESHTIYLRTYHILGAENSTNVIIKPLELCGT